MNYDESWRSFCLGFLNHHDNRVVANTLDVLAFYEMALSEEVTTGDNRSQANLLILKAKNEVNADVSTALKTMLNSSKELDVASGLYALGEIARHLAETDRVHFNTFLPLQRLFTQISTNAAHANEMVRRQALMAGRKVANDEIRLKITGLIAKHPEFSLDAESYYPETVKAS